MKVIFNIERFNPEKDSKPYTVQYTLDVVRTDRVLDALIHIYRYIDGSLAFRKSCAHGVCGSDAMIINGKERLACKTLIQDTGVEEGGEITLQPLRHLPVQKDLMVDQTLFLEKFRAVKPYFIPKEKVEEKEYQQSQSERMEFDDATKCINCGSCYSACPVLESDPDFLGPAALVQAARFVFDSREKGLEERLHILDQPHGVWACDNHFACTKACPRDIKITKLINLTKSRIKKYRESKGEAIHDKS